MTRRIRGLALHFDPGALWVGFAVLPTWVMLQPLPCVGVTWRR